MPVPNFTDQQILAARPPKNSVSPLRPYAFLNETEYIATGQTAEISTIFLTNRECPFRCLMCDLWKNTLDVSLAPGQIIQQIRYALGNLPPATRIKLYNSGNFFDARAIPPKDLPGIAALVQCYDRVIVENIPCSAISPVWTFNSNLPGNWKLRWVWKPFIQTFSRR